MCLQAVVVRERVWGGGAVGCTRMCLQAAAQEGARLLKGSRWELQDHAVHCLACTLGRCLPAAQPAHHLHPTPAFCAPPASCLMRPLPAPLSAPYPPSLSHCIQPPALPCYMHKAVRTSTLLHSVQRLCDGAPSRAAPPPLMPHPPIATLPARCQPAVLPRLSSSPSLVSSPLLCLSPLTGCSLCAPQTA